VQTAALAAVGVDRGKLRADREWAAWTRAAVIRWLTHLVGGAGRSFGRAFERNRNMTNDRIRAIYTATLTGRNRPHLLKNSLNHH